MWPKDSARKLVKNYEISRKTKIAPSGGGEKQMIYHMWIKFPGICFFTSFGAQLKEKDMKKQNNVLGWIFLTLGFLVVINFIPMISLKTPAMEKYELSGITTYVQPSDLASARRIASNIAAHAAPVTARLDTKLQDDISLIVYPGIKRLHVKTIGLAGIFLPNWYIGKNTRESVLIVSSDNPGPAHSRASVEKAAVHEYVHVLTDRHNQPMDYWLKEGFALYLAEQTPSDQAVRSRLDITGEEFSTSNAIRFAEVGGYTIAYVLVEYLESAYGWDTVLRFLEPGSDFVSVLEMERTEVLEEMKDWKRSRL